MTPAETGADSRPAGAGAVDALRRRLYRPEATAADLEAYRAAAAAPPGDVAAGRVVGAPARARRVRSAPAAAAVGAALLVVLAAALVAGSLVAARHPASAPLAVPGPRPTAIAVAGRVRSALLRGLAGASGAGLLHLAGRDAVVAAAVPRSPLAGAVERHGTGPATIVLPPPGASFAGSMTVLLVTGTDGPVGWRAARLVIHADRTIHLATVAQRGGPQTAGVPTAATFPLGASGPPQRIFLRVPAHVRWDLATIPSMGPRPSSGPS